MTHVTVNSVWNTSDGRRMTIKQMSNNHLANTVIHIGRKCSDAEKLQESWSEAHLLFRDQQWQDKVRDVRAHLELRISEYKAYQKVMCRELQRREKACIIVF